VADSVADTAITPASAVTPSSAPVMKASTWFEIVFCASATAIETERALTVRSVQRLACARNERWFAPKGANHRSGPANH